MTKRPKAKRGGPKRGGTLPSREALLEFIAASPDRAGKREIARAFGLKGGDRIELKRLIAELTADGTLVGNRKRLKPRGALPATAMLEITGRDADGELIGSPIEWDDDEGPLPRVVIEVPREGRIAGAPTPGIGDRVLARVTRSNGAGPGEAEYRARPNRVVPRDKVRALGIFHAHARGGGEIQPIDRKAMRTWTVRAALTGEAKDGDLVRFDLARTGRFSAPEARVAEVLGNPRDERQVSLIAVHAHGIPDEFPKAVLDEVERLEEETLGKRKDLRDVPLITIDPEDARDHDDAVWARPDPDPRNPGGHIVIVAIADVAGYVRNGTRLDREAQLRGNSVYFPDRVVPMLPERLSNHLCSLIEGAERPCLAVRMTLDAHGRKRHHVFERAMMRSAAKLAYAEAQAAIDGRPSRKTEPLLEPILRPLWAAYRALATARAARGPLDLDLPERKIRLDGEGRVAGVVVPERLDAHRLIEEMMIQANVAAAETLEARTRPCVYRIHDRPTAEKLKALGDFLQSLDLKLAKGASLRPSHFNEILARARAMPEAELVNEVVLRAQAQAEYNVANIGHFGLNLERYAHFTSPIRRYADLLVHRALIGALGLGSGGAGPEMAEGLGEVARTISVAERRAMSAERETIDRLIAGFLADRVGAEFSGRISGVTRSGLFVKLRETGADGFIPAGTIDGDYWRHDEGRHALIGDRTGTGFQLGDRVDVRLAEAVASAGALRFEMVSEPRRLEARGPRRLERRTTRPSQRRRRG